MIRDLDRWLSIWIHEVDEEVYTLVLITGLFSGMMLGIWSSGNGVLHVLLARICTGD